MITKLLTIQFSFVGSFILAIMRNSPLLWKMEKIKTKFYSFSSIQ